MQETRYRQEFLTTYKSFASAEEVFDLLVAQFNLSHPTDLSLKELEQWKEKRLMPNSRRVLTVLQVWNDQFGLLQDDPYLARRVVDFVSSVTSPAPLAAVARDVLKSLERYVRAVLCCIHAPPNVCTRFRASLPHLSRPSPNGPRKGRTERVISRAWIRFSSQSICACTSNGNIRRSGRRSVWDG